jgi:hypothetical protein
MIQIRMAWAYSRLNITGMYIKWIGFDEEDDEEREVKLMDDDVGEWEVMEIQKGNVICCSTPRFLYLLGGLWPSILNGLDHGQYPDSEVRSMSVSFNSVTQSTSTKLNGLIWLLRTLEV